MTVGTPRLLVNPTGLLHNVYHELVLNDIAIVRTGSPLQRSIRMGPAVLYVSVPMWPDPSRAMDLRVVIYAILNGILRSLEKCNYNIYVPFRKPIVPNLPLSSHPLMRRRRELLYGLLVLKYKLEGYPDDTCINNANRDYVRLMANAVTGDGTLQVVRDLLKEVVLKLIDSGLLRVIPKKKTESGYIMEFISNTNKLLFDLTISLAIASSEIDVEEICKKLGFESCDEYRKFLKEKTDVLRRIVEEVKNVDPQRYERFANELKARKKLDPEVIFKNDVVEPSKLWNLTKVIYSNFKLSDDIRKDLMRLLEELGEVYYIKGGDLTVEMRKLGEKALKELEEEIREELGGPEALLFKTLHGEYYRVAAGAGALPSIRATFSLNVLPFVIEYPPAKQVVAYSKPTDFMSFDLPYEMGFVDISNLRLNVWGQTLSLVDAIEQALRMMTNNLGGVPYRDLAEAIVDSLRNSGYDKLSPYQQACLELALNSINTTDPLLLTSPPGSGKTLIFMLIAIMEALANKIRGVEEGVVLIYPRRTLAKDQIERLAAFIYHLNNALAARNLGNFRLVIGIRDGDSIDDPSYQGPVRNIRVGNQELCANCSSNGCTYYLCPPGSSCSNLNSCTMIDWFRDEKFSDRDPLVEDSNVDIVVTNHSMLYKELDKKLLSNIYTSADISNLIKDFSLVVLDEAHLYVEKDALPVVQKVIALLTYFGDPRFIISSATASDSVVLPVKHIVTYAIQGLLKLCDLFDVTKITTTLLGSRSGNPLHKAYGFYYYDRDTGRAYEPLDPNNKIVQKGYYCGPFKIKLVGVSTPAGGRAPENTLVETLVDTIHFTIAAERASRKFHGSGTLNLISMTFFDSLRTLETVEKDFRERQVLEARDVLDRGMMSCRSLSAGQCHLPPSATASQIVQGLINNGVHVNIAKIFERSASNQPLRERPYEELCWRFNGRSALDVWLDDNVFEFTALNFHPNLDDYKQLFSRTLTLCDLADLNSQTNNLRQALRKILELERDTLGVQIALGGAGLVAYFRRGNSLQNNLFSNAIDSLSNLSTVQTTDPAQLNAKNLVNMLGVPQRTQTLRLSHLVHFGEGLSRSVRLEIEDALKRGQCYLSLSTQTLEVGVDLPNVISVVQYDTKALSSTFIQRLGRSGRSLETFFLSTGIVVLSRNLTLAFEDEAIDYFVNVKISHARGLESPSVGASMFTRLLYKVMDNEIHCQINQADTSAADVIEQALSKGPLTQLNVKSVITSVENVATGLQKVISHICQLYSPTNPNCVQDYDAELKLWIMYLEDLLQGMTKNFLQNLRNVLDLLTSTYSIINSSRKALVSAKPRLNINILMTRIKDLISVLGGTKGSNSWPSVPSTMTEVFLRGDTINDLKSKVLYVLQLIYNTTDDKFERLQLQQLISQWSNNQKIEDIKKVLACKHAYEWLIELPKHVTGTPPKDELLERVLNSFGCGMRDEIGNEIEDRLVAVEPQGDWEWRGGWKFLWETRQLRSR